MPSIPAQQISDEFDKVNTSAKLFRDIQAEVLDSIKNQKDALVEISTLELKLARMKENGYSKNNKVLKEIVKNIRDHQNEEKKINDELRISQKLLKNMMSAPPTMTLDFQKMYGVLTNIDKLAGDFSVIDMFTEFKPTMYIAEKIKEHMGGISAKTAALLFVMKQIVGTFIDWDKAATSFRYTMGFLRKEGESINKTARDLTIQYTKFGLTLNDSLSTLQSMSNYFGGIWNYSKQLLPTLVLFNTQLGIGADTALKTLQTFAVMSGTLMEANKNTLLWSKSLSNAAGVSFSEVLGDITSLNTNALLLSSRLPSAIAKTAVELRRMGSSFNEAADASRSILNFTESVNAEMEASVLLGKSINLQGARQLAYSRDLEGSTKEILRIAKENNFATGMDVFQQEAFAKATGRSVEELLNMIQIDKELNHIRAAGTTEQKAQLKLYEDLRKQNSAMRADIAKTVQQQLMQRSNAEYLVAIQYKWNSLLIKAQSVVYPILSALLSIVPAIIDISARINGVYMGFLGISKILNAIGIDLKDVITSTKFIKDLTFGILVIWEDISNYLKPVGVFFSKIGIFIEKIASGISKFVGEISKVLPIVGKILAPIGKIGMFFLKWLEPIGWVVAAIQFIYSLVTRFSNTEFVKGDWIGNIWKGIKAIGGALYDVLISPFVDAYKWIASVFVGNSPSQLGMGIVNGIVSVGTMIYDALTSPFRDAMGWIANKFGLHGVADKLRGGLGGMLSKPVESKASATYIDAVKVTPNGTRIASPTNTKDSIVNKETAQDTTTLADVVSSIKALTDAITSGKVKAGDVYLDGSLLSSTLARSLDFHGNYGVNK